MPEPALTIVSLLRDPVLHEACGQWLRGGRYRLEWIDPQADPVDLLQQRAEGFDIALLEQGVLPQEVCRSLVERGLLLPTVVIGAVTGRQELHPAEVHLPPDQLEQLSYSLDAAVSRFLRRGVPGAANVDAQDAVPVAISSSDGGEGWKLTNRLRGRLGYLGVYYKIGRAHV